MGLYLHLTVRYWSDRYHGNEWPPSPARMFQALVAGGKTGGSIKHWAVEHERALVWLERLGAPDILARPGQDGQRYTIFVPNNSIGDGRSTKTSKSVAPKILAGHSPGDPDLVYRWYVADDADARAHAAALDQLAARLHALGWGVDFAAATVDVEEAPGAAEDLELFVPAERGGLSMRLPEAGFLAHLDDCHQAFLGRISARGINPSTRPTRFGRARYRRAGDWRPRRSIAFEMRHPREDRAFAVRWDQVQTVAAWLRHAAGEALLHEELAAEWIDSFVLGHTESGDRGHRLSYLPLPSIRFQNSDGGVRRVLIAEPPDTAAADREGLDLLRVKLAGTKLIDGDKKAVQAILTPVSDVTKVFPFYTGRSRVWETVTPVILHGHNTARQQISLAKTDRLLMQGFASAGFPENLIRDISFQQAPYWTGCGAANAIRVPRHLANWPRLHVRVEFAEDVRGPVLAGIGRHYGIGVFARR